VSNPLQISGKDRAGPLVESPAEVSIDADRSVRRGHATIRPTCPGQGTRPQCRLPRRAIPKGIGSPINLKVGINP
jgi:hypothetical protein